MLFHCCVDYHLIRVGTLLEQTYLTLDCIQYILNFRTQEEKKKNHHEPTNTKYFRWCRLGTIICLR
jgi:hypothetical protein